MEDRTFSHLVVIGASAGGIEATSTLLSTLPEDFPAPIVVALHLKPDEASNLENILSRRSPLPVRTLLEHNSLPLESGTVFVIPSDRHVDITDSDIWLREDSGGRPKPSVDRLLESAAGYYGDRLTAVVLTGTGSDGSDGARAVKKAGGTVIVQNPETAAHPGMPRSLAPNTVDLSSELENIGAVLRDLLSEIQVPTEQDQKKKLEEFLQEVRSNNGIDFRSYKTPTIMRRLQRRIVATNSGGLDGYIRYLEENPGEYQQLVNAFLIKVTEFFRDPELFEFLRNELVPGLVARARESGERLRIWSAGCATGEEAYSLAILVCEALGNEADHFNVRIFATDLDEKAVEFARRGVYPAASLATLPEELLDRYFTREDGHYQVRKPVRSMIVFGQHDLAHRAPFPRVDLVLCRNVLIYFTPELQKRTLQLFAYSLKDGGYLLLGKSETTASLDEYFALENKEFKVYQRYGERFLIPPLSSSEPSPVPGGGDYEMRPPKSGNSSAGSSGARQEAQRYREAHESRSAREEILLHLPVGIVIVDRRYDIRSINVAARRLLSIGDPAVGEDLLHLVRGAHYSELRSAMDTAFREGRSTEVSGFAIEDVTTGEPYYLKITCYAYREGNGETRVESVMIAISDISGLVRERNKLEERLAAANSELECVRREHQESQEAQEGQNRRLVYANRQLTEANQELTSINEELQATNEEYAVSSEEAQAATEEVETLNEELQATNEELETLNEELQSTIEEPNTTNEDLHARTQELHELADTSEEQHQESEKARRRLDDVFMQAPVPTLILQGTERTVEFVNDSFERVAGWPADELLGRPVGEVLPETGEGFREMLDRAYAAEGLQTANASSVELDSGVVHNPVCRPLLDADGRVEGAIVQAFGEPEE